ncbi:hypothetical protein ACVBEJ_01740 [Porticoccus sp. GXU_MW_L64]
MKLSSADIQQLQALKAEAKELASKASQASNKKEQWQDIETRRARGEERALIQERSRIEAQASIDPSPKLQEQLKEIELQLEAFGASPFEVKQKLHEFHSLMTSYQAKAKNKRVEITEARIRLQQGQPEAKIDLDNFLMHLGHKSYPMARRNQLTEGRWVEIFIIDYLFGGQRSLAESLNNIWRQIDAEFESLEAK